MESVETKDKAEQERERRDAHRRDWVAQRGGVVTELRRDAHDQWTVIEYTVTVNHRKKRHAAGWQAGNSDRPDFHTTAADTSAAVSRWVQSIELDMRRLPTSTYALHRLPVYQPTQVPHPRTGEREVVLDRNGDEVGWVKVVGRLGQRHADVLAAVMWAGAGRWTEDGGIEVTTTPADIKRAMGIRSTSHLEPLLRELIAASIELYERETKQLGSMRVIGHLLDHLAIAGEHAAGASRLRHVKEDERVVWRIRIGAALAHLWRSDYRIRRDPAPVAALGSGVSQAVARYVGTHSKEPAGGWRLDTVLAIVSAGAMAGDGLRNARRAVRADGHRLPSAGAALNADRSRVVRSGGVKGELDGAGRMAAACSRPSDPCSRPSDPCSRPSGF